MNLNSIVKNNAFVFSFVFILILCSFVSSFAYTDLPSPTISSFDAVYNLSDDFSLVLYSTSGGNYNSSISDNILTASSFTNCYLVCTASLSDSDLVSTIVSHNPLHYLNINGSGSRYTASSVDSDFSFYGNYSDLNNLNPTSPLMPSIFTAPFSTFPVSTLISGRVVLSFDLSSGASVDLSAFDSWLGDYDEMPSLDLGYTSEFPAHKTFVVPAGYAAVLKCPSNYITDDGYIELRTNLPWKVGGNLFSDLENGVEVFHDVLYLASNSDFLSGGGFRKPLIWSTTGTFLKRTNAVYHVVSGDDIGGEFLYIINPVTNWVNTDEHKGMRNNAITVEPSLPLNWVKVIKLDTSVLGSPVYDIDSPTYQYAEVTTTEGAFNSGFVESENNAGDTVGELTIPVASLGAISSEDLPSVSSPTDTINLGSLYEKGNQSISNVLNQTHGFFDNVASLFAFLPPDFVKVVLSLFTILVAVAVVKLFL